MLHYNTPHINSAVSDVQVRTLLKVSELASVNVVSQRGLRAELASVNVARVQRYAAKKHPAHYYGRG